MSHIQIIDLDRLEAQPLSEPVELDDLELTELESRDEFENLICSCCCHGNACCCLCVEPGLVGSECG